MVCNYPYANSNGGLTKLPLEVWTWMSNYISLFKLDVDTYPCPKLAAGLANICW